METTDVTKWLIADANGPGDRVRAVQQTKGARVLTPALKEFLDRWIASGEKTIGFISNALAYGAAVSGGGAAHHKNMIRLIKGGYIRIDRVYSPPPAGSQACRDAPYGASHYIMMAVSK